MSPRLCRKGHQITGKRCIPCRQSYHAKRFQALRMSNPEAAREKSREGSRRDRARYPERARELRRRSMARWRANHAEEHRSRSAQWKKENPGIVAEMASRRRARRRGVGVEKVNPSFLRSLLVSQEGRCYYCRDPLVSHKHLDHKVPLSRGGEHRRENVCWSCPGCNLRKSTKTEDEFFGLRKAA